MARERKSEILEATPIVHLVGKDALDYFMRNTGRINLVQKSARSQAVELLLAVLGNLREALSGQGLSPEGRRALEIRNAREFGVWFFNLDGQGGQKPPEPGDWNSVGLTFDRQMAFFELGKLRAGEERELPHVNIFALANAYFLEREKKWTYPHIGKELGISVGQARDYCLRVHELLHGTEAVPPKNKRERLGADALACEDCRYSLTVAAERTCTLYKFHEKPPSSWGKLMNAEYFPAWDVADEKRKYGCPDLDRHLNAVTLPLREMLERRSDLRGPANDSEQYKPKGHTVSVQRGREELESYLSPKWLPGQTLSKSTAVIPAKALPPK